MNVTFLVGKRFAFSILDDMDQSTVENIQPVYDLLADLVSYDFRVDRNGEESVTLLPLKRARC